MSYFQNLEVILKIGHKISSETLIFDPKLTAGKTPKTFIQQDVAMFKHSSDSVTKPVCNKLSELDKKCPNSLMSK